MRDRKLELRNLHASHTLGCTTKRTRDKDEVNWVSLISSPSSPPEWGRESRWFVTLLDHDVVRVCNMLRSKGFPCVNELAILHVSGHRVFVDVQDSIIELNIELLRPILHRQTVSVSPPPHPPPPDNSLVFLSPNIVVYESHQLKGINHRQIPPFWHIHWWDLIFYGSPVKSRNMFTQGNVKHILTVCLLLIDKN